MPLNLTTDSDYMPHVRWMASTSQWTMSSDGEQQPIQWETCLFDLENIKTGYGVFAEGCLPEWIWDADGKTAVVPADGREWKRGFSVNLYSPRTFGGDGVREFASNLKGAMKGIKELYNLLYEPNAVAGQIPLVKYCGPRIENSKNGFGGTSVPIFQIEKFIARPPAFDEALLKYSEAVPQAPQVGIVMPPPVSHVVEAPPAPVVTAPIAPSVEPSEF
jgi:hypothetical protein